MGRRRRGKPTWQNMYHQKPENTSDETWNRWEELQEKISAGMQRSIDRLTFARKNFDNIKACESVCTFIRSIPKLHFNNEDEKLDYLFDQFLMSDQG